MMHVRFLQFYDFLYPSNHFAVNATKTYAMHMTRVYEVYYSVHLIVLKMYVPINNIILWDKIIELFERLIELKLRGSTLNY